MSAFELVTHKPDVWPESIVGRSAGLAGSNTVGGADDGVKSGVGVKSGTGNGAKDVDDAEFGVNRRGILRNQIGAHYGAAITPSLAPRPRALAGEGGGGGGKSGGGGGGGGGGKNGKSGGGYKSGAISAPCICEDCLGGGGSGATTSSGDSWDISPGSSILMDDLRFVPFSVFAERKRDSC